MLYWHWIVLGVILAGLEIIAPSFFLLLAGFGAVTVGLVLAVFPSMSLEWQLFIWLLSTSLYMAFWFKVMRPRQIDKTKAGLSLESIQGQIGLVLEKPEAERRGKLRFSVPVMGSDEWAFLSDDDVAVGDRVRVKDISGNTLVVVKQS